MASRRQRKLLQFNLIPYNANSYGEKLHNDQNKKLNMFGVIHVLAVDGFSRKIVGFITIRRKNPIDVYHALYRPLLLRGNLGAIHVDHGTKFCFIGTSATPLNIEIELILYHFSTLLSVAKKITRQSGFANF